MPSRCIVSSPAAWPAPRPGADTDTSDRVARGFSVEVERARENDHSGLERTSCPPGRAMRQGQGARGPSLRLGARRAGRSLDTSDFGVVFEIKLRVSRSPDRRVIRSLR